jgi:D-sedoheptulose 7-phosphate isomerase
MKDKIFEIRNYYDIECNQHVEILHKIRADIYEPFAELVDDCVSTFEKGNKLFLFGNGGSASDAQHIATELVVRFRKDRRAIPAIALTTDTSALTAIGNDFGFDNLFSRQIEALCVTEDIAIGISTSGNSENVIRGLYATKQIGAITVALGGDDGGQMKELVDHAIIVPSKVTARIQEIHIIIGHILCGAVEKELGLV